MHDPRTMPPALTRIDLPGLRHYRSGKVREVFDLGHTLLFVASDRISAFDCIMPNGIPLKGHVLNQLSAWWFRRMTGLVRHHIVETNVAHFPPELRAHASVLKGRSMIVRKTNVIPIECVARGYLIGSGWKEYQATGTVSGIKLRPGYQLADRLDEPIFTPAHKAETGHDENIAFANVVQVVGRERAEQLRHLTLKIYEEAAAHALSCGLILADTKFEFGLIEDDLVLIDEILTPDSSRFWPVDAYRAGSSPPSFDKQYLRDYLETLAWNKQPPAPVLPEEVVRKTQEKYLEAFRRLTGTEVEV